MHAASTQQCGRFHELPAFDDKCRSCRKELELHNQRRRKRAAALAAAGELPQRSRKGKGTAGDSKGGTAHLLAGGGEEHAHGLASAPPALAEAPHYMPPPLDFLSPDFMQHVMSWGGAAGNGARGKGAAPPLPPLPSDPLHAAQQQATNAGITAALAAVIAARHMGTGASIYGGGDMALLQLQPAHFAPANAPQADGNAAQAALPDGAAQALVTPPGWAGVAGAEALPLPPSGLLDQLGFPYAPPAHDVHAWEPGP